MGFTEAVKEEFPELQGKLRNILSRETNVDKHWYSKGPAQLLDHLYLGDYSDADSYGLLSEMGITHVLNCAGAVLTSGKSPYVGNTSVVAYKEFDADDIDSYPIVQLFEEAFAFIESARIARGKVLVHCARGVNRSAAVCVAYLMVVYRMDLWKAVDKVKQQRGRILTNKGFQAQLIEYAAKIKCI